MNHTNYDKHHGIEPSPDWIDSADIPKKVYGQDDEPDVIISPLDYDHRQDPEFTSAHMAEVREKMLRIYEGTGLKHKKASYYR